METIEVVDYNVINEKIARFMGARFDRVQYGFEGQGSLYRRRKDFINSLEYHCSLDALMPVVDKIVRSRGGSLDGNIQNVEFHMKTSAHGVNVVLRVDTVWYTKTLNISKPLIDISGVDMTETIYKAVTAFLNWYI